MRGGVAAPGSTWNNRADTVFVGEAIAIINIGGIKFGV
jgi:hypothetical protein